MTKLAVPDGSSNTTTFKIDTFEGVPNMLTTQTDALNKTVQSQTDVKGRNLEKFHKLICGIS